jgi:hypothetical protein
MIVCILGPPSGGKTTLLRTMASCLAQEASGYAPGYVSSFNLTEVQEREFNEGVQEADRRIIKRPTGGRYAGEEAQFHAREAQIEHWGQEVSPRASDGPADYHFLLEWALGPLSHSDSGQKVAERVWMQIVDAAGDLSTWSRPPPEDWTPQLDDLEDRLRVTDAVLIVVPLDSHGADLWATHLHEVIDKLVGIPADERTLKRLIVVFSKYEYMFTRFGTDAASVALRPHAALYTIRREFQHRRWLQRLSQLALGADVDLRFTVASSLGFVRLFGAPNVDADTSENASSPMRFRVKTGSTGELVADPLWRPFITADPFIFAATGLANAYTFTAEDVEIQQAFEPFEDKSSPDYPILDDIWPDRAPEPPSAPPRRSAIERATRGTLGALKRFFNASGD